MTTPPLPPEIKSAEEHIDNIYSVSYVKSLDVIRQRDLAIWNAAIEKAAELKDELIAMAKCDSSCPCRAAVKAYHEAILNLKRKE